MTNELAAIVLEGLSMKHHRLAEYGDGALAEVHGEIAKALEVAISALGGTT